MRDAFLARLREEPSCLRTWLVYADWLDEEGDPTGPFVRESLEVVTGLPTSAFTEEWTTRYESLFRDAQPETRELLAVYRSGLPTRFRVLQRHFIGDDPPQELGGFARTLAVGVLETGRIRRGADLGLSRRVQALMMFDRDFEELSAGREPLVAGVGWLGHLNIEIGSVLRATPTEDG